MNILFVCTHNRCRSILSEALLRDIAGNDIAVASAGSAASGQVHPLSIAHLRREGIDTTGLHSKSWDDIEDFAADVVITVCDSAAGEACPLWLGNALKIHWPLKDPSSIPGSEREIDDAFTACIAEIRQRCALLLDLVQRGLPTTDWPAALASTGATTGKGN